MSVRNATPQPATEQPCSGPLKVHHSSEDLQRLILYRGFDRRSLVVFLKFLTKRAKCDDFMRLYAIFGRELLLFLSIFHSETLKVPALSVMNKIKLYSQVYAFLESRGFTEEAYKDCSKLYGRRRGCIDNIVLKVRKVVGDEAA